MTRKLHVVNPLTPGGTHMGRNRALRLQKAGKLIISPCGTYVNFLEDDARIQLHLSVDAARRGYDRVGRTLSLGELKHIPVVCAEKLYRRG
jgi:hypothetical protein